MAVAGFRSSKAKQKASGIGGDAIYCNPCSESGAEGVDVNGATRFIFLPAKMNYAAKQDGLSFTVASTDDDAPRLIWDSEPATITLEEAMSETIACHSLSGNGSSLS